MSLILNNWACILETSLSGENTKKHPHTHKGKSTSKREYLSRCTMVIIMYLTVQHWGLRGHRHFICSKTVTTFISICLTCGLTFQVNNCFVLTGKGTQLGKPPPTHLFSLDLGHHDPPNIIGEWNDKLDEAFLTTLQLDVASLFVNTRALVLINFEQFLFT